MKNENETHLTKFLRLDVIILTVVILVAFLARVGYKFDRPLADFHSWRQADTAAVSRNFIRSGFDLMHPRYDDFSNIQSGKENPQGYRFVEFPLYNALIAVAYLAFPVFSIEIWGRLISVFSCLIVIGSIYYFLLKEHSRKAAVIGSLTFAIFPFFVFFSSVVLPEMNAVAFTFASLLLLYIYFGKENRKSNLSKLLFVLSLLSFMCALLIKPTVIFYALPFLYLFIFHYSKNVLKQLHMYAFFIISIIPFLLWRKYILQFPEGIPASSWLITSVNTSGGLMPIFFRPAFFRWVFYERINNLILGGNVTAIFIVGVFTRLKTLFLLSILAASLLYVFTFQGGNVQHVYYQVLILPTLAMFVGTGAAFIIEASKKLWHRFLVYPALIAIFTLSFAISFMQTKGYYGVPQDLLNIADVIRNLTDQNDKIVTDTLGDTTLLYLSDRRGAPAVFKSLPELKKDGYKYFVTLDKGVAESVKKDHLFRVVGENQKFTLFKL